jgi:phosphocarrier protein HPr
VSLVSSFDPAVRRRVIIPNQRGMHARPAARFVECAERFHAQITVASNGIAVPGTSIMGLLMLGAGQGAELTIEAVGAEAEEAVAALAALVECGFQEG